MHRQEASREGVVAKVIENEVYPWWEGCTRRRLGVGRRTIWSFGTCGLKLFRISWVWRANRLTFRHGVSYFLAHHSLPWLEHQRLIFKWLEFRSWIQTGRPDVSKQLKHQFALVKSWITIHKRAKSTLVQDRKKDTHICGKQKEPKPVISAPLGMLYSCQITIIMKSIGGSFV